MGGPLGENGGMEGREQSSGMKLLSSYSCCGKAFQDVAIVIVCGSLNAIHFTGVVGWKPNYCLVKLIKREKKAKHIVCLVVKERKKAIGGTWKRLNEGRDLGLFAEEGRGLEHGEG